MSLTSLLKQPDVKKLFRETFPFKPFSIDADLKAPPVTAHYAVVGTAFDYLARWRLGRMFPDAVERPWVAEHAVRDLAVTAGLVNRVHGSDGDTYEPATKDEHESFRDYNPKQWDRYNALHDTASAILDEARAAHAQYVKTGIAADGMFRAALRLVGLDWYMRSGGTDGIGAEPVDGDVEDLRRLWGLLESGGLCDYAEKLKSGALSNALSPVVLNPEFGRATAMVGGADADIIIDGMLVDVKTTKNGRFTTDYYHQLVGYWALSMLGGVDKASPCDIGRLGVYFSRHGVLKTVGVPSIMGERLNSFLGEFRRLANIHRPTRGG